MRMRETRFKECASGKMLPRIQLTQLDMPGDGSSRDGLTAASCGGNEASGRGRGGESKESKNRCWEEPKKRSSLTEILNNAANSMKEQKQEKPMKTASPSFFFHTCLQGISEGSGEAERQRGHRRGMQWSDGNTHAICRDRLERTRRDSENKHSKNGTRPSQAVLKECEETIKAEENRSAEGPL